MKRASKSCSNINNSNGGAVISDTIYRPVENSQGMLLWQSRLQEKMLKEVKKI